MDGRLFSWVYKHAGIYKKYNSDIEKGSACRSLFYSAYPKVRKYYLINISFMMQKQLCKNEVNNQNNILNIDTTVSIQVCQGIFVFYT